eukprot:Em0021g541a
MALLDLDGDGKFSYEDLLRVYTNTVQEPTPNAASSPVVLRKNERTRDMIVDEVNNGFFSPTPSLRKSIQARPRMSDLDEIRQRFESVNEAGSGLVGYEGLCKMYEGAEKSDIDKLMTIIDLDGDGKFSYEDLLRVYTNAEQQPTQNAVSSPVVLRKNERRMRNMVMDEVNNGFFSPIQQSSTPSLGKSVQDVSSSQQLDPNINRASKVWSWISDWGDLPVDGSYNNAPQDHSSPVPPFLDDEDGISSTKTTLQSMCGNSDTMDSEAVKRLCKHVEATPEDEDDLRALLLELDAEKKGSVSMERFAQALHAAKCGAAVTSTPSPTYGARRKRFSQHTIGEPFSAKPEFSFDSSRSPFTSQVVSEEQPSLSVLNVDNTGYIKISSLLKRWHDMGVNTTENKDNDLERILKMTLPIDSLGRVSVSDVTSLLESAISDDIGQYDSSLRCVALASFRSEIEILKKRMEEIEGENIQLKQTSSKAAEEKKRLMKEADESLESAIKTSAQKLEHERSLHTIKLNETKREFQNRNQTRLAIYEGEIEQLKAQLHESRSREKELSSGCKDAKDELDYVQEQLRKALREVQEKEKECIRLKGNLSIRLESTCTFDHEDQLTHIKELEEQIAHCIKMNEELKEEKQTVQDKHDLLQQEYDALKTKYSNFKRQSKEQRSAQNSRHHSSMKSRDKPIDTAMMKRQGSDRDEPDEGLKDEKERVFATTHLLENFTNITAENENLRQRVEVQLKSLAEAQLSLQQQVQHYRSENCQLQILLNKVEAGFQEKLTEAKDEYQVKLQTQIDQNEEQIKMPFSDLEEERKNNHLLQEILANQYKQAMIEHQGYKLREEQYLQAIAKFKEEKESLVEVDFPETSDELMAQTTLPPITLKPSSYIETLALMKSQLDAVRESLKHTKRTPEASHTQNDIIKKLYAELANLRVIKEQNDQSYREQMENLESCVQSIAMKHEREISDIKNELDNERKTTQMLTLRSAQTALELSGYKDREDHYLQQIAKHEQEFSVINNELDNERKTTQMLTSQSAQTALELSGYKDREEHYLQQIAKLKEENESLVETDLPETSDELIAQATLPPITLKPSSYDETLALMKSHLDAVRESLKHRKRTPETSQMQRDHIKQLYTELAALNVLKEKNDQTFNKQRADLESCMQTMAMKHEQEVSALNNELDNERKTTQMLTSECAQTALELSGYKDREEHYLQQIAKLKEENESLVETDLPESSDELMAQATLPSITLKPSSYDETLALMKSHLDAVSESLKPRKRTPETSQMQRDLIKQLYTELAALSVLKEKSDQTFNKQRADWESCMQTMAMKHEQAVSAINSELDNERKTTQMLTSQSAQNTLELSGYKDRVEHYLQQIEKHEQEFSAINIELDNERKTIQMLTSQSAQTALELSGYKDREEHYLQHIAKLNEENVSLVETDHPETSDELLAQATLPPITLKPSSYDETLALMKSHLDAVRESLKHRKRTPETSQMQSDLIKQLYTGLATLSVLKEKSDQNFNKERADLESCVQTMAMKHEQEVSAINNELDNERKTTQMLTSQSAQTALELSGYKDREDHYLQQIAKHEQEFSAMNNELDNERKTTQMLAQTALELSGYKDQVRHYLQQIAILKEENEPFVETDFPETSGELMAQATLPPFTIKSSSYDETLALMKSHLDAVRESLKQTKRTPETSQMQSDLIKQLYTGLTTLSVLKEKSDQTFNKERADLDSCVQSMAMKHEQKVSAINNELDNERKTTQMLTSQSAQAALELSGYKDREDHYLQQIAKHEQEFSAMNNELDNERKTTQMLTSQCAQNALELNGCKDQVQHYLQQIAILKEENESLVETDFPETSGELMAQATLPPFTLKPSSYDETLALMKSHLDAVRESLKQTKRTPETSQMQSDLIKQLYTELATLSVLKEKRDQTFNKERADLDSCVQSMTMKHEQEVTAINNELDNERKTTQMLTSQCAQTALELSGYKDREDHYLQQIAKHEQEVSAMNNELDNERKTTQMLTLQSAQTALELNGCKDREKHYLQQIAKLKEENVSIVETDFPETSDELMAQTTLPPLTVTPSSYNETLAFMKSHLDAIKESLKHRKRTPEISQMQIDLITQLYTELAALRVLKEKSDQNFNKERSDLEFYVQSMALKHKQELSEINNELDSERKTTQVLTLQIAQTALELSGCKDQVEHYLQQIAILKEENESLVETDFPETSVELMAQATLPPFTLKPSSYDETLALMKSHLDAVRESLKQTKRKPETFQMQSDLIKQLYTGLATLSVLKEKSDQNFNKGKADLESCVQSMTMKHEQEVSAIKNELETTQRLTLQSAQTALELSRYKDQVEHCLQQIAKLKEENESLVETDLPESSDELMAQATLPSITLKPSSYDEILAYMKSHLDAVRNSLSHTKRTRDCAQAQSQLMKLLYKDIGTIRVFNEQVDHLHKKELADLDSNLQSATFKCAQIMVQYDEHEADRRNIQKSKEMLESQISQMAIEVSRIKEREEFYLQQITKLKEEKESLINTDFPDCNDESFSTTNESNHPLRHEETLGQMKSAMNRLRQSLSRAIQTSETLKQKEILVRKLSGDIDSLRSHDEQSSIIHGEEKAKLLLSINQCNEEIRLLRAHLETLTARYSEAAQEVVTSSNLILKDHELLFKLQEKLTNKEAEVEKYKNELESVRERQHEEVKIALDKHDQEVSEALRKDREIKSLQEQLRRHNSSKLDELTGEISLEPEHLRPNRKMVEVGVLTETQQPSETMSVHGQENKEMLRKTSCYIINMMKVIQTEVNNLKTLILCSKDQFRLDVAKTTSHLTESFILLKQKEISSLVVQLMKQHEEEISDLQEKLTLKCGSEVKSDLISMLNTKDHQLQEANGRLELTRREHEEQVMQLQDEKRHLVEQCQAECKAKQDCEQNMKEIILKHSDALAQAKTLAEEQTNSLRQFCIEAMNCPIDTLQDYSHSTLIHLIQDQMKRVHETLSNELSEAQKIAQVQTDSLQKLCIESAHCSREMLQGLSYTGLLGCIKDKIEKMSHKHSSDLNEANTIAELQTAHLKDFCTAAMNCGEEIVCNLNHAGTLEYLRDEIQRRMSKHSEALTQATMLAEEQTNSLRQLYTEVTNCSTNTVQDCDHNGLVDLIRCEMKRAHDKHIKELSKAVHISEVQTDDLRELCNTAIGSELDDELNSFTHEDLLRYIRVELEKIKDNMLQESTRAQLLGDELTVITQRYEGVESTLLEEHDEEVRSLCQQKDLLAQQLEAMKDHYEQLLVQSSEQPQGKLVEELQNAKGEVEQALLQKTNEVEHLICQSEELRQERKVFLEIIKQLCSQFKPIELDNTI